MRHYESIKTIEFIYDYTEISGPVALNVELAPGASLSINGKTIEDPSIISYSLKLNENTPEIETEWLVTSADNIESVYTIRETNAPIQYTQVEIISPENIDVEINNKIITVNYDYQVNDSIAEIRLKSETNPPLLSEIIVINLDRTDLNPELSYSLPVATSGKTYTEDYTLKVKYKPRFFSFSTGQESDFTHPGPHVLAGYLTLFAADAGKGYILVKKNGETAPDFNALKAQAPDYQIYDLKKNQAQWAALINLEKNTNYTIYVGVEFGPDNHMGSLSAKTLAAATDNEWGILYEKQGKEYAKARTIRVFEGQTIIIPGIISTSEDIIEWFLKAETTSVLSIGYSINSPIFESIPESGRILGEDFSNDVHQYHLELSGIAKQQDKNESIFQAYVYTNNIENIQYKIKFQD